MGTVSQHTLPSQQQGLRLQCQKEVEEPCRVPEQTVLGTRIRRTVLPLESLLGTATATAVDLPTITQVVVMGSTAALPVVPSPPEARHTAPTTTTTVGHPVARQSRRFASSMSNV